MTITRVVAGALTAVTALMAASPEGASAKCDLTPTVPELALVLNGEKVFEVPPDGDLFDPALLEQAGVRVMPEEILRLNLGCHTERDESTGTVRIQHAVYVTTIETLALSLVRLSGLQGAYRASKGRYATDFAELPKPPTLQGVTLTMEVHGSGWTSTARFSNSAVTCHLAQGEVLLSIPGQTLGQVICIRPTTPRN